MSTYAPARIGERWNPRRLAVILDELQAIKHLVVVSGGWAWHFMSPPDHEELKHAHDHKDADVYVAPHNFGTLVMLLKQRGYRRAWTRFDRQQGDSPQFYRYARRVHADGESVKVMLDVFVGDVPSVEAGGFQVVEPAYLLTLYSHTHASGHCFAVRAVRDLLSQGIDPVGRPEMADYRRFLTIRKGTIIA